VRRVLLIGATSAIVEAAGRRFAQDGDALFLLGRSTERLQEVADDYLMRGASAAGTEALDALDYERHAPVIEQAVESLGGLDIALIGHGMLPDQNTCEASFEAAREVFEVNTISVISMMTWLANYFEAQASGTLMVISSVSGDRARRSNYVYGTAKGAVSMFAEGLCARLSDSNVNVVNIKPGFVDTPMTAKYEKGLLWATPEQVARTIYRAARSGRSVLYTPWFWHPIMLVIRFIPASILRRLPL
jgi:short-subunit dehydrogenase